jgi:hypothetical protein
MEIQMNANRAEVDDTGQFPPGHREKSKHWLQKIVNVGADHFGKYQAFSIEKQICRLATKQLEDIYKRWESFHSRPLRNPPSNHIINWPEKYGVTGASTGLGISGNS